MMHARSRIGLCLMPGLLLGVFLEGCRDRRAHDSATKALSSASTALAPAVPSEVPVEPRTLSALELDETRVFRELGKPCQASPIHPTPSSSAHAQPGPELELHDGSRIIRGTRGRFAAAYGYYEDLHVVRPSPGAIAYNRAMPDGDGLQSRRGRSVSVWLDGDLLWVLGLECYSCRAIQGWWFLGSRSEIADGDQMELQGRLGLPPEPVLLGDKDWFRALGAAGYRVGAPPNQRL